MEKEKIGSKERGFLRIGGKGEDKEWHQVKKNKKLI
jgi:hypothetical protein